MAKSLGADRSGTYGHPMAVTDDLRAGDVERFDYSNGPDGDHRSGPLDRIPDVRDGLTRVERVVLWVLHETQRELGGRYVPTAMLYGRVVEHVSVSQAEFQSVLTRMVGRHQG